MQLPALFDHLFKHLSETLFNLTDNGRIVDDQTVTKLCVSNLVLRLVANQDKKK